MRLNASGTFEINPQRVIKAPVSQDNVCVPLQYIQFVPHREQHCVQR